MSHDRGIQGGAYLEGAHSSAFLKSRPQLGAIVQNCSKHAIEEHKCPLWAHSEPPEGHCKSIMPCSADASDHMHL